MDHLQAEISWNQTGDPVRPYHASVAGASWTIRVNDFPEEHLYTLLIDGQEFESFDDWPACWSMPRLPSMQV
jgi:hypothetical protein